MAWSEQNRLNAVLEAFWGATPEDHDDMGRMEELLIVTGVAERPTPKQLKAVFMMFPPNLIGNVICWDFSDTEVREKLYEFVEENKPAILAAIAAAA